MDAYALQRSWDQVTKHGDQVPLYFYSHIFVSHPEVRSMFPLSMSNQRDKFVSALGRIVSHADQIEKDTDFLQHLGRDHRKYAVVTEHYDAVGASLCATLKHFLGSEWDEELAAHWTAAYQVIARIMVEAAETSSESSPDWWDADVVSAERRTMDLTLLTVRPRRAFQFLPGQSVSMEVPQRPRLWRYFSPANAPRQDGSIDLHVQQIDGGQVSPTVVRSLKVGDTVKLGAPDRCHSWSICSRTARRGASPFPPAGRCLECPADGRRGDRSRPSPRGPRADRPRVATVGRGPPGPSVPRRSDALAPLRPSPAARTGPEAAMVRVHGGRIGRPVLSRDAREGRHGRGPAGAVRAHGDGMRRPADGRARAGAAGRRRHAPRGHQVRALLLRSRGRSHRRAGATRSGDN